MRILALFVTLFALASAGAARADSFDDYGYQLSSENLKEIRLWSNTLPAIGNAGKAFIGCSSATNASEEKFSNHFDICWTLPNQNGSCSHRCGAAYNVFGFWTPNAANPGKIDYTIFCRCNQIVHWYDVNPVPSVLWDLGVAD